MLGSEMTVPTKHDSKIASQAAIASIAKFNISSCKKQAKRKRHPARLKSEQGGCSQGSNRTDLVCIWPISWNHAILAALLTGSTDNTRLTCSEVLLPCDLQDQLRVSSVLRIPILWSYLLQSNLQEQCHATRIDKCWENQQSRSSWLASIGTTCCN